MPRHHLCCQFRLKSVARTAGTNHVGIAPKSNPCGGFTNGLFANTLTIEIRELLARVEGVNHALIVHDNPNRHYRLLCSSLIETVKRTSLLGHVAMGLGMLNSKKRKGELSHSSPFQNDTDLN